jgi:ABC-type nickel/cobalt efflux system permease component RcnA
MRVAILFVLIAAVAVAIYLSVDFGGVTRWAVEQQRAFQNQMAAAIRALRSGDPGAYAALLGAAGAYGFVHAFGPGHGKYLIAGVGLGSAVPMTRLLAVALASSLAQALSAITLVYGGFLFLEVSARRMTALAEDYLAPASYLAIASVGIVLVWRGTRSLTWRANHDHKEGLRHSHGECGCHAHGPLPDEVAKLGSLREAAVLVGSIAVRPCTGAIFLLVIAWQMDIRPAGAAAVVVMGLGTAALTGLVAVSSIAARGMMIACDDKTLAASFTFPALQVTVGVFIIWISLLLLCFNP